MKQITCVRCGAVEDEQVAAMGEDGIVCQRCHLKDVEGDKQPFAEWLAPDPAMSLINAISDAASAASQRHQMEVLDRELGTAEPAVDETFHNRLREAGARCERSVVSETVEVAGVKSAREGYDERWLLPSAPEVQGRFAHEGFFQRLNHLFRREVHVGDEKFDAEVSIETTTAPETRAWLGDAERRAMVLTVVKSGGYVLSDGSFVEIRVLGPKGSPPPADLGARIALSLLGA